MHILKNRTFNIIITMFFFNVGCKFLGFLRQIILANCFGTGSVVDAYVMAQSIPNILFGGILVAISASFMPLLSKRYEKFGLLKTNEYISRIIIILLILSVPIACLGIIGSKWIVSLMASGFNDETKKITEYYLRFTFGYTFFVSIASIFSNFLQYQGIFRKQILGDYFQNILFILFIWIAYLLSNKFLIFGLFCGYILRAIYFYFLAYKSSFRFHFKIKGILEDLYEIKHHAIPIFIGTTANEINTFIDRTLASKLDPGSVASLNYAYQINSAFIELTITIIATVVFPRLVQLFTINKIEIYKKYVKKGLVICMIITLPLTIWSIIYSNQIISLIFERGAFDVTATYKTASAFMFYSIGSCFFSIVIIMGKVFYSTSNMKIPMICSSIAVVINIIGNIILVKFMGHNGLALATSLANMVNAILLIYLYSKSKYAINMRKFLKEIIKILFISIFTMINGYGIYLVIMKCFFINRHFIFLCVCLITLIIYFILLVLFKIDEVKKVVDKNV